MLLVSGNSPDSTARGCANRFRISRSRSGRMVLVNLPHRDRSSASRRYPGIAYSFCLYHHLRLVAAPQHGGLLTAANRKRRSLVRHKGRMAVAGVSRHGVDMGDMPRQKHTSFCAVSLMRLRSLLGSSMTSPLTRRLLASALLGLPPRPEDGLSLRLTQGASPGSGISRVTLP